jgi:hypothetical protein
MKFDSEKAYTVLSFALYPIWGLMSSTILFTHTNVLAYGWFAGAAAGIGFAGLLPAALHLYESRRGKADFAWSTLFLSLLVGGIAAVMFGAILQGLLVICGVRSLMGMPIDRWYWNLPLSDY